MGHASDPVMFATLRIYSIDLLAKFSQVHELGRISLDAFFPDDTFQSFEFDNKRDMVLRTTHSTSPSRRSSQ